MNRRFNFTGRLRLERAHARVSMSNPPGAGPQFAALLELSELGLPEAAEVFVEAYRQMSLQRFDFGTVGKLRAPSSTRLSEFSDPAGVLFRVKVVGTGSAKGRLLAEADRIRPVSPEQEGGTKRPLLPVAADDLGGEVWRLEMDDGDPVLKVERSLGDPVVIARSPDFAGLVYPAVIQLVLGRVTSSRDYDHEEPTGWHADWLKFALQICGVPAPRTDDDSEQKAAWVATVAREFSRKHDLVGHLSAQWDREAR